MSLCRLWIICLLLCLAPALSRGQDVYVLMTLHNLGCRQADHTYTGMIPANSFDEGDRVDVILAGTNGRIDAPNADGTPGGDDQLAQNPGVPFAMNPASFTHWPNTFYSPEAILIQRTNAGPEPALHVGSKFYVRAWNGPAPHVSSRYFNSQRLWQDFPIGVENCNVDSAVRTVRTQLALPSLITYAVTFDAGHAYSSPQTPLPQVLTPNGGETWMEGDTVVVRWSGAPLATHVDVLLRRAGSVWEKIIATTANDSSAPWIVTLPEVVSCSLRVQESADTTRFDLTDSTFAIITVDTPPLAPRVVAIADSAQVMLLWPRVAHATHYQIEQSVDFVTWEIVSVTPDTTYIQPVPTTPFVRHYFRIRSQR